MQNTKKWSQPVTRNSHALSLEPGVFTWTDPKRIAASLAKSACQSNNLKSIPFRSAMSMLNFYINRAGKKLSIEQKAILGAAKEELRTFFGKQDDVNK